MHASIHPSNVLYVHSPFNCSALFLTIFPLDPKKGGEGGGGAQKTIHYYPDNNPVLLQ